MASAIDNETGVYLGPTEPTEVMADFVHIFGKKVMLDVDAFAGIESLEATRSFERHLFEKAGVFPRPGPEGNVNIKDVLPAHMKDHLKLYEIEKKMCMWKSGYLSGAFCCDVSQNPAAERSRCGAWMQSAMKSSYIVYLCLHIWKVALFKPTPLINLSR